MSTTNKKHWWQIPLTKELIIVLIIKLVLIFVIYKIWFDQPIKHPEKTIEQHLLG